MSDATLNPGKCWSQLTTFVGTDSPIVVGIVFAAVLTTAFLVGVGATIYYAWILPAFARYQLRRKLHKQQPNKASLTFGSPDLNNNQLNTPSLNSPTKDVEKCDAIFVKELEVTDNLDALPLPKPTFFAKQDRFSTSTRDGVWWIV